MSRAPTPSERKDPRDANPMFKRLPAEIVSRRRVQAPTGVADGDEVVSTDRKVVFLFKPELRLKWLVKALKQATEGKLRPSDLYDVVNGTRFAENVVPKVGRKMGKALLDQVELFSPKQQKFLKEQAEIITRFVVQDAPSVKGPEGDAMNEMMARVAAFVSEKQSERAKGDDGEEGAAAEAEKGAKTEEKPSVEEKKDKKEKKDKDKGGKVDKEKEEKKSSKDAKAKSKNGAKSSSSSSRRSRSKSRTKKKQKRKNSSKKDSKKRSRSSDSSSSSSSRSSSSDSRRKKDDHRKTRHRSSSSGDRKRKGKKKRKSSSSESSSRDRKKKKDKKS